METRIQGSPRPETLTGTSVSVLAPGFTGRFVSVEPGVPATRGGRAADELPLAKALSLTSVSLVLSGEIELDPPARTRAAGVRAGPVGPPKVIVKALPEQDYAMLHTDEFGRKRWIFPDKNAATRGTGEAVFSVPTDMPPIKAAGSASKNTPATRGVVTKTMRRLLSVVTWVAAPLVQSAAKKIAQAWEAEKRPHGLWQVAAGGKLAAPDWSRFDGSASLLVIHGTFSTPSAGFGSWFASDEFATMLKRYHGRVLALAHPSLSAAPEDNIDWLLEQLPGKAAWKGSFDVVCHSRGGLVARELAARAAAKKAPIVDRVCQVGTPNLGTVLADPTRWVAFLDTYTNCLTMLPDSTATIVLEGLLCLVKIVGTGAADGLPGLVAMNPSGPWIKAITTRSTGGARWYTIGTNYAPAPNVAAGFIGRVAGKATDVAIDAFFKSDNDMVVPSAGCHQPGVAPVDSLALDDSKTTHTSYFESVKVRQTLAKWLS